MLSEAELREIDAMDEYERLLAYDRIGRGKQMSALEVESQYQAWKGGGVLPSNSTIPPANVPPQGSQSANYITDASRYRPSYDPSKEAVARRSQIANAVMCPSCGSALGIPATRPIKVTCPSCMSDFTFTS